MTAHRVLDVVIAALGLVILMPLIALISLAILIEDGRPIFFSQTRLGLKGKHFRIYKFRKFYKTIGMTAPLTVKNDSRMTRLGHFLARTKLDELPQFWNVLKGDMSIVGPRPESTDFADCFTGVYERVLDYKPGIFGPSQVYLRDESSLFAPNSDPVQFYRDVLFHQKALNDLTYYPHRTIVSDIGWIILGILVTLGFRPTLPKIRGINQGTIANGLEWSLPYDGRISQITGKTNS